MRAFYHKNKWHFIILHWLKNTDERGMAKIYYTYEWLEILCRLPLIFEINRGYRAFVCFYEKKIYFSLPWVFWQYHHFLIRIQIVFIDK